MKSVTGVVSTLNWSSRVFFTQLLILLMTFKKEKARIIYEACLGYPIRSYQWLALKEQMNVSMLPLTADNLRFVAKCKKIAPRYHVNAFVLNAVGQTFYDLGDIVCGVQLKRYVFTKHPEISKHKFYRAFRSIGFSFCLESEYKVRDLGEVLYLLFSKRGKCEL